MTKKEKTLIEDLRAQLARRSAFQFPSVPKPNPVNISAEIECKPFGALFIGWYYHASLGSWGSYRVTQGCSNGISHSPDNTQKTSTQGVGRFYQSKADALLAARWDLCEAMACILANLDAEPKDEESL